MIGIRRYKMKKIILSIFLVGMLVLVGCEKEICPEPIICPEKEVCEICQECEVCEEIPEEKALLSGIFAGWGVSETNSNELLFAITVYNYGYIEAKDVTITCYVDNKNNNRLFKKSKMIGNIGSTSNVYKDMSFKKTITSSIGNNLGYCYISSCSNCEILDGRIPSIKEVMK